MPNERVCPWWRAYIFDNPVRRLIQKPEKILGGLIQQGQTVLDIGCGMGFFSLGMARLVGEEGRVISVDLQKKMLDALERRAKRAGLSSRIQVHQCQTNRIGTASKWILPSLSGWSMRSLTRRPFLQKYSPSSNRERTTCWWSPECTSRRRRSSGRWRLPAPPA